MSRHGHHGFAANLHLRHGTQSALISGRYTLLADMSMSIGSDGAVVTRCALPTLTSDLIAQPRDFGYARDLSLAILQNVHGLSASLTGSGRCLLNDPRTLVRGRVYVSSLSVPHTDTGLRLDGDWRCGGAGG